MTQVTEGTRKSLFIVDVSNGLGEKGVVELTGGDVVEDVVSFFAQRALAAGRKRAAGEKRTRDYGSFLRKAERLVVCHSVPFFVFQ